MQKLKVGFFGGSFNPPINTHIHIANNLIEKNILDKVVFVPVGDYYEKQGLISAIHRFNMLKLACNNLKKLDVEDIAIDSKKKLFAVDTLKLLYDKYNKNVDIYFIMGSDNFQKMPTWKNYEKIINNYKFIVIERPKYEQNVSLSNVIYYNIDKIEDITSSALRNKIVKQEDVSKYINSEVFNYIQKNNLYFQFKDI